MTDPLPQSLPQSIFPGRSDQITWPHPWFLSLSLHVNSPADYQVDLGTDHFSPSPPYQDTVVSCRIIAAVPHTLAFCGLYATYRLGGHLEQKSACVAHPIIYINIMVSHLTHSGIQGPVRSNPDAFQPPLLPSSPCSSASSLTLVFSLCTH